MQDIQEIVDLLEKEGCRPLRSSLKEESFQRKIQFSACGIDYFIEWWENTSYLTIGASYANYIPFDNMTVDLTWPSCRRGLRFSDKYRFVVVATKKLDWQEQEVVVKKEEAGQ